MTMDQWVASLAADRPPSGLPEPLQALWWDAKGNWAQAHSLIDTLETQASMAVHGYLHRKEGEQWNADYWYRRAGLKCRRTSLAEEWADLVDRLLQRNL